MIDSHCRDAPPRTFTLTPAQFLEAKRLAPTARISDAVREWCRKNGVGFEPRAVAVGYDQEAKAWYAHVAE